MKWIRNTRTLQVFRETKDKVGIFQYHSGGDRPSDRLIHAQNGRIPPIFEYLDEKEVLETLYESMQVDDKIWEVTNTPTGFEGVIPPQSEKDEERLDSTIANFGTVEDSEFWRGWNAHSEYMLDETSNPLINKLLENAKEPEPTNMYSTRYTPLTETEENSLLANIDAYTEEDMISFAKFCVESEFMLKAEAMLNEWKDEK